MKKVFTLVAILALMNFTVAGYSLGGEVKKQPLQMEQLTELSEKQAEDAQEVLGVEAGMANGFGLLTLALTVAVGYLIYEEVYKKDD